MCHVLFLWFAYRTKGERKIGVTPHSVLHRRSRKGSKGGMYWCLLVLFWNAVLWCPFPTERTFSTVYICLFPHNVSSASIYLYTNTTFPNCHAFSLEVTIKLPLIVNQSYTKQLYTKLSNRALRVWRTQWNSVLLSHKHWPDFRLPMPPQTSTSPGSDKISTYSSSAEQTRAFFPASNTNKFGRFER